VACLALAVIATAAIVAVARPWAVRASGPAGNTVGLIDAGGGRVGAAVSVSSPAGLAYRRRLGLGREPAPKARVSRINPATHAVVDQIPVGFRAERGGCHS